MKKTTLKALLFSFFTLSSILTFGQSQVKKGNVQHFGKAINGSSENQNASERIRCYSTEYEAFLKSQDPSRLTSEEFETWLAPKIKQIEDDRAAGRSIQAVYNIPVVIHIVHNGDCIGTGENITDAQAISQIKVLNEDYRRLTGTRGGANTTGAAVDSEINFVLAKRDPSGNPTNGIDRIQTSVESYNRAAVQSAKASTIWDPTKYLNMWTFRFGGDLDGVLGYAQFPDNTPGLGGLDPTGGAANTDGVVASFDAMGTIDENDGTFILNSDYNLGRTMTHEVGHWLGLRHIWGDGDCTADDFCADTPNAGAPNFDCAFADSCPAAGVDQYQNYMDYSYDYCMDTFTANQKTRMVAVMTNSPRRSTLNASNGAIAPSAGVYFNPNVNTCSYIEMTNCSYTDINYPVSIIKAPTQNTVITFTTSGTATNNLDYQILTPTVTFAAGSTTSQTLTIRYFNDGFVETNETLTIGMTINANGGDGALITSKSTLNLTITDNDSAPSATQTNIILEEDFEDLTGWLILDGDGDGNNWGGLNSALNGYGTAPNTITGQSAFSEKRLNYLGGTGNANPVNNYLISPQIVIPAGANAVSLTYIIGAYDDGPQTRNAGNFSLYFTTSIATEASILAGTLVQSNLVVNDGTTQLITNNLLTLAGQTGYLVFRHNNTSPVNNVGLLILDTVNLIATISTSVQTEVNTATAYQASVPTAGTFHPVDATTSKVIASITADNFNYGCTNVSVSRSITSAAAPAVNYGANTANNMKVMAKTVTVSPATNNASGNASLKFYFTEAEIAAWETATGNNRSLLKVFKGGETTAYATTIGAFGTNVTLTATSTTGMGGVYYFGTDATLTSDSFNPLNAISIYPNPTNDVLNVNIPTQLGSNVNYQIFNYLGQVVKSDDSSSSNFSISTSSFSNGVYFIKLNVEGSTKTLRFIKN